MTALDVIDRFVNNSDQPRDKAGRFASAGGAALHGAPARASAATAEVDKKFMFSAEKPAAAKDADAAAIKGDHAAAAGFHEKAAKFHADKAAKAKGDKRKKHEAAADAHLEAAEAMRVADRTGHTSDLVSKSAHSASDAAKGSTLAAQRAYTSAAFWEAAQHHEAAALAHGVARDKALDDDRHATARHHEYHEAYHKGQESYAYGRVKSLKKMRK